MQIQAYLVDGLIRYENLLDDWWDVDVKHGIVRGQQSGTKIGIGDVVKVYIVRVDVARRELDLAISEVIGRARQGATGDQPANLLPSAQPKQHKHKQGKPGKAHASHKTGRRGGGGNQPSNSKSRKPPKGRGRGRG